MSADDFFDMNFEIHKRDDYKVESWTEAGEKAEADGFTVVMPTHRQVLLDLDTPEAVAEFMLRFARLSDVLKDTLVGPMRIAASWPSKSGVGRHVVVDMGVYVDAAERLTWQAVLGSDYVREAIAVLRKRGGVVQPSRLFKPAVEKGGA